MTFISKWLEYPNTPIQGHDKTDTTDSVSFDGPPSGHPESTRCRCCLELEHQGTVTLICGKCGYQHPKVSILHVLDGHRLTGKQIAQQTNLDANLVYQELGMLLDRGAVCTDSDDTFGLPEAD